MSRPSECLPPSRFASDSNALGDQNPDTALDNILEDLRRDTFLCTPPTSSPAVNSSKGSAKPRKIIRFQPVSHDIPSDMSSCPGGHTPRPSFPSKPTRSILKPFAPTHVQNNNSSNSAEDSSTTFLAMLESVLKQLASDDRSAHLDAWHTLHTALIRHTYASGIQDLRKTIDKVEPFLKRDLGFKTSSSEKNDTRGALLPIKICILLMVDASGFINHFAADFLDWLANTSMELLSSPNTPKELVKNSLYIFTIDAFCARTLTSSRVVKMIQNLYTIHERITGAAIQSMRISAYGRALKHHSLTMLDLTSRWLPVVLRSMHSNVHDVQRNAVEVGLNAARTLGAKSSMTAVFSTYCNAQDKDSRLSRYHIFEKGVSDLLEGQSPEAKLEVPRIWGAVILFLRGSGKAINHWPHFKGWMGLLTRCFRLREPKLTVRCFTALNRLLFALKPDEHIDLTLLAELLAHIMTTLKQPSTDISRPVKAAARSTLCVLLFYGFRPSQPGNHAPRLDFYWHRLVKQCMCTIATYGPGEYHATCRILSSLLGRSTLTAWNESMISSNFKDPVRQGQIPRINIQWIRSRASQIALVFDCLALNIPSKHLSSSGATLLEPWAAFMASLAEAGRKDITMRPEQRAALSCVGATLDRLRNAPIQDQREADVGVGRAGYMVYMLSDSIRFLEPTAFFSPALLVADKPDCQRECRIGTDEVHYRLSSLIVPVISDLINGASQDLIEDLQESIGFVITSSIHAIPALSARLWLLRVLACSIESHPGVQHQDSAEQWIRGHVFGLMVDQLPFGDSATDFNDIPESAIDEINNIILVTLSAPDAAVWNGYGSLLTSFLERIKNAKGREYLRDRIFDGLLTGCERDGRYAETARQTIVTNCVDLVFDPCELPAIDSQWGEADSSCFTRTATALSLVLQLRQGSTHGLWLFDDDNDELYETLQAILNYGKYLDIEALVKALPSILEPFVRSISLETASCVFAKLSKVVAQVFDSLHCYCPFSGEPANQLQAFLDACLRSRSDLKQMAAGWCHGAFESRKLGRLPDGLQQARSEEETSMDSQGFQFNTENHSDPCGGPDTPSSLVAPNNGSFCEEATRLATGQPSRPVFAQIEESHDFCGAFEESWLSASSYGADFDNSADKPTALIRALPREIPSTPTSSNCSERDSSEVHDYSSPIESLQRGRGAQRRLTGFALPGTILPADSDMPSSPLQMLQSTSASVPVGKIRSPSAQTSHSYERIHLSTDAGIEKCMDAIPHDDFAITCSPLRIESSQARAEGFFDGDDDVQFVSPRPCKKRRLSWTPQEKPFPRPPVNITEAPIAGHTHNEQLSSGSSAEVVQLRSPPPSSLSKTTKPKPAVADDELERDQSQPSQSDLPSSQASQLCETRPKRNIRRSCRIDNQPGEAPSQSLQSELPEKKRPQTRSQNSHTKPKTPQSSRARQIPEDSSQPAVTLSQRSEHADDARTKRLEKQSLDRKRKHIASEPDSVPSAKRVKPATTHKSRSPSPGQDESPSQEQPSTGLRRQEMSKNIANEDQTIASGLVMSFAEEPCEHQEFEPARPSTPEQSFHSGFSALSGNGNTPSSTQSSQSTYIEAFTDRLKNLFKDARKLLLGDEKRAKERQTVERLASGLSDEILAAGSRKRKRASKGWVD